MAPYVRRDSCRLCDSKDIEIVMELAPTPIGDDYVSTERLNEEQKTYPLDLILCKECGHIEIHDNINPELIYGNYIYETSISLGLPEHFQRYADNVIRRVIIPENSVVADIGCNDGTLLRSFKNRGMQVFGVEPSSAITKKVQNSGIHVYPTYFSHELAKTISSEQKPVNLLTANNVMANIDDLHDFADGVREILASDGVFIFETGYGVDLIQNTVIDNIHHEHLCYFRIKPLSLFFNRHGLEVIDAERVPTKGGSLRCTVQHKGGLRQVSQSVIDWIFLEESLGFSDVGIYQECAAKMDSVKIQLKSLISDIRSQGNTVSGYGSSVGTTTLLYYFGLEEGSLDYLFDDNPTRDGMFSPGCHLPVLSSEQIYEKRPDYILIFAWRYAAAIIKRHQNFLDDGGKFLIPLPRIKVI